MSVSLISSRPASRLCYVSGSWAYFTTRKLSEQWGDDWNDAPYEHNAGEPYSPCWHREKEDCWCDICKRDYNSDGTPKWTITKVAFDGSLCTPDQVHHNSPYSVEKINQGACAWLYDRWGKSGVSIQSGATIAEFKKAVEAAGGSVYLPAPAMASQRAKRAIDNKQKGSG